MLPHWIPLIAWLSILSITKQSPSDKGYVYNADSVIVGKREALTAPLPGIVVLHAMGWKSIFARGCEWINQTLFPAPFFTHVSINDYFFMDYLEKNETVPHLLPTVLIYNVENSGDDALYKLPRLIISKYNIPVIFNPSDEWKGWWKKYVYGEGTEVYPLVEIALREYSVLPYRNTDHPHSNVIQVPLNYPEGFFTKTHHHHARVHIRNDSSFTPYTHHHSLNNNDTKRLKYNGNTIINDDTVYIDSLAIMRHSMSILSVNRPYFWAFIGTFEGNNPGYVERRNAVFKYNTMYAPSFISSDVNKSDIINIYRQARFVLVTKGQYNLECYRYTEAAWSGAIPIVVANEYEYTMEYYFENNPPPFLYSTSYDNAFDIASKMSNETIDEMRKNITIWYIKRFTTIHEKVKLIAIRQHEQTYGHREYLKQVDIDHIDHKSFLSYHHHSHHHDRILNHTSLSVGRR